MGFWQIPVPRQVESGSILSEKWGVGPSGGSAGRHDGGVWRHHTKSPFSTKWKVWPEAYNVTLKKSKYLNLSSLFIWDLCSSLSCCLRLLLACLLQEKYLGVGSTGQKSETKAQQNDEGIGALGQSDAESGESLIYAVTIHMSCNLS